MSEDILNVEHLNAYYEKKQALYDVSFNVKKGEIVGIVGESGSGKSTLAKSVLGLIKNVDGKITHYSDMPQMIFQDPFYSLNPSKKIIWLLMEPLRVKGVEKEKARIKAEEMAKRVGLEKELLTHYPKELSGGQRQRVCIAVALMNDPEFIIADEPVSALDVTIQSKIVKLLYELNRDYGIAILFISHDLRVVYQLCDRIIVMKDGRVVESGTDQEIYFSPQHPYTKELLSTVM